MHDEGVYFYFVQKGILTNYIKLGRSSDVFKRIKNELKQTLSLKSVLQDGEVFIFQTNESVKVELLMKHIVNEIATEDNVSTLSVADDSRKELYKMNDNQIERFFIKFKHKIIQNKLNVREITNFRANEINMEKSDKIIPSLIENFDKIKNFSFQRGNNIGKAQKENISYRVNKITSIPIEDIIQIKNNKIKFNDIKKDDNTNYNISDLKWDINHTFISNELINLDTKKTIDLLTDELLTDELETNTYFNSEIDSESLTDSDLDIDSEYNPETDSDIDYDSDFDISSMNCYTSLNSNNKQNIRKIINEQIQNTNKLTEKMLKFGLKEFEIVPDGNCQFRAVAHQLFSNQERHAEIRHKVCAQLLEKADCYKEFCCNDNTDYYTWVDDMTKDSVWGDNLTLQAVADAYHVNIRLITSYETQSILFINPIQSINRIQPKLITLIFKPEIHYSSVEPINSEFELANILTNLKNNLT